MTARAIVPLMDTLPEYAVETCGSPPLSHVEGCWARQVNDQWWLAINGHREPVKVMVTARGGGEPSETECPPFTALIYYNGWPAGIVDPYNGCLAAGAGANERTLRKALKLTERRPTRSG